MTYLLIQEQEEKICQKDRPVKVHSDMKWWGCWGHLFHWQLFHILSFCATILTLVQLYVAKNIKNQMDMHSVSFLKNHIRHAEWYKILLNLPKMPFSLRLKMAMLTGSRRPLPFAVAIPKPLPEDAPFKFFPLFIVLHGCCWFSYSFVGESTNY